MRVSSDLLGPLLLFSHYVTCLSWSCSCTAAEEEAARERNLNAAFVGPAMDKLETEFSSSKGIVKDLVASFLLPEVERMRVREQVTSEGQKYRLAAEEEVRSAIASARDAHKK